MSPSAQHTCVIVSVPVLVAPTAKRVADTALATAMLVPVGPRLILVAAVLVRVTSRAARRFYSQVRLGRGGVPFHDLQDPHD